MIFGKKLYIKGMELKQNKNRRILTLIAPLAIGFSLCACGSEVAGGGSSGTEAGNAITAQILIADAPAAKARIKLVEHNSLNGLNSNLNGIEGGYTATTNDSGIVTIEKVPVGSYTLEAILNETALQLPVDVKDTINDVNLGAHSLQKSVYIGGSIADFIADSSSDNLKNMTGVLKFRGLDHFATVTNGKFEVKGLPAGNLNLVFIPENALDTVKVSVETDAGDSITTLKPNNQPQDSTPKNERLLIDDFEDGDNLHNLAADYVTTVNGGTWYIASSSTPPYAIIQFDPELPAESSEQFAALLQNSSDGGKEINLSTTFPDTSIYKSMWACICMYIGNSNTSYDLSAIDSISFDAWGEGTLYVQILDFKRFTNPMFASIFDYISGNYAIKLPKEKTKFTVALADVLTEDERKSVSALTFAFRHDAKFHFDNLEFIGKDLLSIWKQQ